MKNSRMNRPPPGEPFVWQTRELLSSAAWRSMSINGRRVLDFLLLEWMGKGGRENGRLKAPHRQLEAYGVGARLVAGAIREVEDLGLVACNRGGMRIATTYALTWLPLHDGTPASNRWRLYRNPDLAPLAQPKARNLPSEGEADCGNLPHEGEAALPSEGEADGPNLPHEGEADGPKNLPHEGEALLREDSYQGRGDRFRSIHGAVAGPLPGARDRVAAEPVRLSQRD
jgi:hypothetical protein